MRAARLIHTQSVDGTLTARRVVQSMRNPTLPLQLEMRSVGAGPGSLVQIEVPASTPVYARRHALSGVLGAQASSIISRSHILSRPFARLLARQPLLAQRILSTEPATLLIGSRKTANLMPLELDGTRDWVITPAASIDAFAGPALTVRAHTSWAIGGFAPFAHILLRGRGSAVISSTTASTVYELDASESVLVQRKFLAGFSVDPNIQVRPKAINLGYTFSPLASQPATSPLPETTDIVDNTVWRRIWTTTRQVAASTYTIISKAFKFINTAAKRGNSDFIQIHGPSTVLISGSANYAKGTAGLVQTTKTYGLS